MREIIVLDVNPADGGYIAVNCVFWFQVPAGSIVPLPSFQSVVNSNIAGVQQVQPAELQGLMAGTIVEEQYQFRYPNTFSVAQIKAELQTAWATRNTYRGTLPSRVANYGLSWDGTTWSS